MVAVRKGGTLAAAEARPPGEAGSRCRHITDQLQVQAQGEFLALGRNIHDPSDPVAKMLKNILATFAEFPEEVPLSWPLAVLNLSRLPTR